MALPGSEVGPAVSLSLREERREGLLLILKSECASRSRQASQKPSREGGDTRHQTQGDAAERWVGKHSPPLLLLLRSWKPLETSSQPGVTSQVEILIYSWVCPSSRLAWSMRCRIQHSKHGALFPWLLKCCCARLPGAGEGRGWAAEQGRLWEAESPAGVGDEHHQLMREIYEP